MVVSEDIDFSRKIANGLANLFSMRYFDQIELFEFDHAPLSFDEVYNRQGEEYVLKKLKGIIQMELDFDNSVFVCDSSFAENCMDIFYKILLSNFVIYLDSSKKESVKSNKTHLFFNPNEERRVTRKGLILTSCCDLVISADNLSDEKIVQNIYEGIKDFYHYDN